MKRSESLPADTPSLFPEESLGWPKPIDIIVPKLYL
jgi:hypothetical protein